MPPVYPGDKMKTTKSGLEGSWLSRPHFTISSPLISLCALPTDLPQGPSCPIFLRLRDFTECKTFGFKILKVSDKPNDLLTLDRLLCSLMPKFLKITDYFLNVHYFFLKLYNCNSVGMSAPIFFLAKSSFPIHFLSYN